MTSPYTHAWDVTEEEAVKIQAQLRPLVQRTNGFMPGSIKTVAGVDCSLREEGLAAIVVLSFPDLEIVDKVSFVHKITFPYVPGLLSFRETPIVLAAMEKLKVQPDMIMVDGQGIAHPRRFGIACHLGLFLDKPSIGCAKSVLSGHYDEQDLGQEVGDMVAMKNRGETVAVALRTRKNSKPMIISIGHKIDLDTAMQYVKACLRGYRLPETTRLADKYSKVGDTEPLVVAPLGGKVPRARTPKAKSGPAQAVQQDTMFDL